MKTDAMTAARLKELLHYEPTTGVFTWLKAGRIGSNREGKQAGSRHSHGYVHVQIDGVIYGAHRLAWLYVHGVMPSLQIDHRNGVRDDNRIDNLRDASSAINAQNRHCAQRNNQTGLIGAHRHGKSFTSKIKVEGKTQHLGSFETAEAANVAYLQAKRVKHAGCTL